MASQSIKLLRAELVKIIRAGVLDFKTVTARYRHFEDFPDDGYPVCMVRLGAMTADTRITSIQRLFVPALIYIIGKPNSDEDDLLELDEDVIDTLNANKTLGETCIHIEVGATNPPDLWDSLHKIIVRRFDIEYRRDT